MYKRQVIANGQVKLPNFYSVLVDDTKAIRMASDYMFDHGRMDLFYVFDIATDSGRAKRQGFLEAMKLRDVPDGNDLQLGQDGRKGVGHKRGHPAPAGGARFCVILKDWVRQHA